MPLATLENLRQRYASDNQKASTADVGVQDLTFQAALDAAEQDLRDALECRGYTAAQVLAGDRLSELHLNQSLYHLYFFGGVPHGYDLVQLKGFDRVKAMGEPKYGWRIGGVIVWPGAAVASQAAGEIGYGTMTNQFPTDLKTW